MLYYFVKYLSNIGFRVNFKKVFFHYQEKIPNDKPVIFAVNHPTAFIDPVLIGSYYTRATHFIVRGDVFKGKLILAILKGLKMLPIFRFRDGYSNLKNNQATMDLVYRKLAKKRCILILAEGATKHEKRLRPIQKGTARMAFGATEIYKDLDILIVPVGVNYTDSDAFRSFVVVELGKPISLSEYESAHQENPRKAIKKLTDRIEKEMRALVIHIEKEADDPWVNRILDIQRNDFKYPLFPIFSNSSMLWNTEYKAVESMNAFSDEQKEKIQATLKAYDQKLDDLKVKDRGVARPAAFNFLNTLFLILGFIPFLVGYVFNYLPMWVAENTAKRKVKKIEFYSSVRFGAGIVGYFIYWLTLLIVSLIVGNKWGIGLVLLLPFLGYFVLIYKELFENWNVARKFKALDKKDQQDLIKERGALFSTHFVRSK